MSQTDAVAKFSPARANAVVPARPDGRDGLETVASSAVPFDGADIGTRPPGSDRTLEAEARKYLAGVERQQWKYYADSVGPQTNYLPPDNLRSENGKMLEVDYRTSPTNIGLYMLSTVTAERLGIIDHDDAMQRLRQTVDSIKSLPKYVTTMRDEAGHPQPVEHLYNWYSINGTPQEINKRFISTVDNGNLAAFLMTIVGQMTSGGHALSPAEQDLTRDMRDMVQKMRFDIFYDKDRGLLHHGAYATENAFNLTDGCYDTVLSEGRCAYAAAIMQGHIPATAWSSLKRKFGAELDNISINPKLDFQPWTGTMFEVLLPRLLMKHGDSPLGQADRDTVRIHMQETVTAPGQPTIWGKSEAHSRTAEGYAAWGATDLSQSRDFVRAGRDVIAPYASQMATMYAPLAVVANLRAMEGVRDKDGVTLRGDYGFRESVTAHTVDGQRQFDIYPAFYAHHIGMGFMGIANYLLADVVTDWFHHSEFNKANTVESLLATPVSSYRAPSDVRLTKQARSDAYTYEPPPAYDASNIIGSRAFLADVRGAGGSTWSKPDYTLTNNELFYVRDKSTGQMLPIDLDKPAALRDKNGGRSFVYDVGDVGVTVDISMASDQTKSTKVIIENKSQQDRQLEVIGYLEWIMDDPNAHLNHPTHRKLYPQTELHDNVITAQRRTAPEQQQAQPFGFFALAGGAAPEHADSKRADILRWLGGAAPASGKFGYTLDPAAVLSKSVSVGRGQSAEVGFVTGFAESADAIPQLIAGSSADQSTTPKLPPDQTYANMSELFRRSARLRRMRTSVVAPRLAPAQLGHWVDGKTFRVDAPQSLEKPWPMVLANEKGYGLVATAKGWAYSFLGNSQQARLTPYIPDDATELPLRGVVVKNKATQESFSITSEPAPSAHGKYSVDVSPGYIKYRFDGHDGLGISMTLFTAKDDAAEFWKIDIENKSGQEADLELSSFLKWALGANYPRTEKDTHVERDADSGAIFATSTDSIHAGSVAFHAMVGADGQASRQNYLYSAQDDPFSGLSLDVKVAPGATRQLSFVLGQAASKDEARNILAKFETPATVGAELTKNVDAVSARLGGLQVKTPDASFNRMMNNWLPYQAYYAHFLARSGYSQSGGAYGFRDQLQTVMNLLDSGDADFAAVARQHLLTSASQQFEKGDVTHWWHPAPLNLGQRSTISDNLLWFPQALEHYVEVTGDAGLLDEQAPFVVGRELEPGQLDYCDRFQPSENTASVYDHARKAIDLVIDHRMGEHGLPLMGKGDWNDCLNKVGHKGKGESVWLGFFLYDVLNKFAPLAEKRGDGPTAEKYRAAAASLGDNLKRHAWNGDYFVRAWADNGETLGFNDVIVQAWAGLSGAVDGETAKKAVGAAVRDLHDEKNQMTLLFNEPMEKQSWSGDLRAYPPGVRESQAQYTHGATWLPRAVAKTTGDGDLVMKLLQTMLPTTHASDPRYGGPPYSAAADIYGADKAGECGWTWYSGAAGWIYRDGMDTVLGLHFRDGNKLQIEPCIPRDWKGYEATYRKGDAVYDIEVKNPEGCSTGVKHIWVTHPDGHKTEATSGIELATAGHFHVEVVMGARAST